MATIGYCRTSTAEQVAGLAAQERDLRAAGAERIVSEQISSVAKRPGLESLLASLAAGDALIVTKPDRLARSTAHMLAIVDDLTARNVGLILLSMGGERLDTRNPTSKLVLTIMAGIAAWEREIMKERQKEGITKAKTEGKFRGSKPKHDHDAVRALAGRIGAHAAADEFGLHRSTVYRIIGEGRG